MKKYLASFKSHKIVGKVRHHMSGLCQKENVLGTTGSNVFLALITSITTYAMNLMYSNYYWGYEE